MNTKEIASLCGVTEQTIRRWCAKNNVPKTRNKHSKEHYELSEETILRIIEAYGNVLNGSEHSEQDARTEKRENTSTIEKGSESSESSEPRSNTEKQLEQYVQQIESQQKMIDGLTEQLAVKDGQIDMLSQQLASLTHALTSAQEAQTRLTEALSAAQALHAGTIQNQLTMQDEKPVGFFGRLFKKKKKENDDEIQG